MRDTRYEIRDTKYMQTALKLAQRGIGSVEPNPAVGCAIVKNNQTIGRGWHKKFGGPHAEIIALEDCKKRRISPEGAAMYVTLEPCCHYGQTGPCADAIIAAKIARVVVAAVDPSEHAAGKGIEQLRHAGIEVQTGLCKEKARLLNAGFFSFAATKRPWVILKWAQSIDGKLKAPAGHDWISSETSRKDAHKLRRRVQAILVGVNTVLDDDPLLTARPAKGKTATRIVLDSNLRIPLDCKLLKTAKKTPLLIVTTRQAVQANPEKPEQIRTKGGQIFTTSAIEGRCNIDSLLDELGKRSTAQLLVEGGAETITSFLKGRFADELRIYIAPKIFGSAGAAGLSEPMAQLSETIGLHYVDIKVFDGDVCVSGLLKRLDDI